MPIFEKFRQILKSDSFKLPGQSGEQVKPKRAAAFDVKIQNPRNVYNLFTTEFSGLSSEQIKLYMESARKGLNFFKGLLFEEIRNRDLRIGGICQTRKLAVAAQDYVIECEDENHLQLINDVMQKIDLENVITSIVEAQIQGVSIFELNWSSQSGYIMPTELRRVPNWLLLYDDLQDEYRILDISLTDLFELKMKALRVEDRVDIDSLPVIDIDANKLLEVEASDNLNPNGFRNGCVDGLIWIYFLKNYGLKDYATYLELFGNPMRIGKYDPLNANAQTEQKLINAVRDFGSLSWAVLSNDMSIEFPVEPGKGSTSDLFGKYLNYLDEEIAIRVLGQTLTSAVGDKGSYAAAKVHETVRQDVLKSDKLLAQRKVNELLKRIAELNGWTSAPAFRFIDNENLDRKKMMSEIIMNLAGAGYSVPVDVIEENIELAVNERAPLAAAQSNSYKPAEANFAEFDDKKKKKIKSAAEFDPDWLDNWLDELVKEIK